MSLWIESHQSLLNHPKTHAASNRLKVTRPTMVGHLHCLWWWCLDYAQDGDVSGYDDQMLASAAMWDGDPVMFTEALLHCGIRDGAGFLERTEDGMLLIHDWDDYAGKLLRKRKEDAERKRAGAKPHPPQNKSPTPQDFQRNSTGVPMEVAGNQPTNITNIDQPTNTTGASALECEIDWRASEETVVLQVLQAGCKQTPPVTKEEVVLAMQHLRNTGKADKCRVKGYVEAVVYGNRETPAESGVPRKKSAEERRQEQYAQWAEEAKARK